MRHARRCLFERTRTRLNEQYNLFAAAECKFRMMFSQHITG